MSHQAKSKAKGLTASSFFELKAEVSKQSGAHKSGAKAKGLLKPDKKPTVWARTNNGVQARAARDLELEAISKPTLDSARAALERKAKIYEKLRKGRTGGLSEAQIDTLLVDFDSKDDEYESDSDVDESMTVPHRPGAEDDPIVEYEDEFGRLRTARRSEVPRHLIQNEDDGPDPDEDLIIRDPTNHFPTYEPTYDRVAEIEKAFAESSNPLAPHYDAARENREKGAAFYSFSTDEETRKAQMEELLNSRKETEEARKEMGAVDVKPGEVEGMKAEAGGSGRSKAAEKRKRDIEERRKLLDAKRRKLRGEPEPEPGPSQLQSSQTEPVPTLPLPTAISTKAPPSDPFAALEQTSPPPPSSDPFAALEQTTSGSRTQQKARRKEADAFLASLEKDIFFTKGNR